MMGVGCEELEMGFEFMDVSVGGLHHQVLILQRAFIFEKVEIPLSRVVSI